MSEPRTPDVVQTPGERAEVRDDEEARTPVPTAEASVAAPPVPTEGEPTAHHVVGARSGNGSEHGTGEAEVECPGCGLLAVGESPRPTAAWFCPRCDYPLFWASPPAPERGAQKRARRRLPGAGGATVLGATACWSCGEMNEPGTTGCVRCSATLPRPQTPEAPPRIVEVTKPVLVPQPYRIPTATWPFVTAGVLAGAALAVSATVWVLRLAGLLEPGVVEPVTILQTAATLIGGG
ncbi:hypothetical protein [Nitriliruptor alkaliphilus]|uniref:hypothetical protein n=1 Tax=Nitriliruptor alkaliphilus TaxID=427918 RepID=UPI000696648E|nr:hypothetical protein [Nitriliruptor alkaliphilus]